MRLTFVTGCSGSGKTLLHDALTKAEQPYVFELDDVAGGLPPVADSDWLRWRATEVLHEATVRAEEGADQHFVVTGIVWPFTLVDSRHMDAVLDTDLEVRFVLLDRPWASIQATLEERLADWPVEDRVEQIDNNRRLQRSLRRQIGALDAGLIIFEGMLDVAAEAVWTTADW